MERGLYTGALGMLAREYETEVIANNLANVSTPGFKRDTAVTREFPEMLLRRFDDELISTVAGDLDPAPAVGRVGTGVQIDDVVTDHTQGPLRESSDPLDVALEGTAYYFLEVSTPRGPRYTRAGSLSVSPEGFLVLDTTGDLVMSETGPVAGRRENIRILPDGTVEQNAAYAGGLNRWEAPAVLGKLKLREFENLLGVEKEGETLYRATAAAGAARAPVAGVEVRSSWLEMSNANVVREMVDLISAQRAYEANAKVVQTYDQMIGETNQIARV